jgi:transcriptional antiterminator RfaH
LGSGYWTAAVTKLSEEQRAAHHIERQGFQFYLPEMLTRHGSRMRREYLFPGYIFVRISEGWETLMHTRGIRRVFLCNGSPTRMRDSDIECIRSRENEKGLIELELEPPLRVGDRIKISAGPFSGHSGIFQGMSARDRCYVLLSVLGRSASVVLNYSAVRSV